MELKPEIVRDILLTIEATKPRNEILKLSDLHRFAVSKQYILDDVLYTVEKLVEAEFIKADLDKIEVGQMTYNGHMFLETIKDRNVWEKTKAVVSKVEGVSLSILTDVASSILKSYLIKE
ncbi:DUF2513 domain-containing protein [Bacillus subtilis]|uniref:DUF2513 domain-containing protein n=1 Tax=Bacillus subtilis TaxID=1423 RepID=UPI000F51BB73|nr:DUF2513 domain-containing protein [Bacillus subtilis]QFY85039.1 DUF2513 domain-containing protein [Bacillus subtilis]RPK20945.1 hypothetical protein EH2_00238 [Bacillus subtilis]